MSERNKEIVRRYFEEEWNDKKAAAAEELIASHYRNHNPFPGQPPGPDGLRQNVAALRAAFPDLQITLEDVLADGDRVAVRWTAAGCHRGTFMGIPPSGKAVSTDGIEILRLVDGKITDAWLEWDLLGLLRQLGAIQ